MTYFNIKSSIFIAVIFLFSWTGVSAADLVWYYSEADAYSEAVSQNKNIILVAGRTTCGNCNYVRNVVFESTSPPIKELIENNFILWFCNIDQSTEHYDYREGLGAYYLPLICVIDPKSENLYEDRTTGVQYSEAVYARLLEHLPEPEIPDTSVWKLISLNKEPDAPSIPALLSSVMDKVISVWAYRDKKWLVYDPENPDFCDLNMMQSGSGYWLHLTEDISLDSALSFTGTDPEKSLSLCAGWNLIGYSSSSKKSLSDAMSQIEGRYVSVWAYKDKKWLVYDPENPNFSDLTDMEPGLGYWVNASSDCNWCCD